MEDLENIKHLTLFEEVKLTAKNIIALSYDALRNGVVDTGKFANLTSDLYSLVNRKDADEDLYRYDTVQLMRRDNYFRAFDHIHSFEKFKKWSLHLYDVIEDMELYNVAVNFSFSAMIRDVKTMYINRESKDDVKQFIETIADELNSIIFVRKHAK